MPHTHTHSQTNPLTHLPPHLFSLLQAQLQARIQAQLAGKPLLPTVAATMTVGTGKTSVKSITPEELQGRKIILLKIFISLSPSLSLLPSLKVEVTRYEELEETHAEVTKAVRCCGMHRRTGRKLMENGWRSVTPARQIYEAKFWTFSYLDRPGVK